LDALLPAITSGAISAILAAFGCYVAVTNRLTKLETLIDNLTKTVEKHNKVVERTFILERDMKTAFMRIDENREEIKVMGENGRKYLEKYLSVDKAYNTIMKHCMKRSGQ